MGSLTGVIDTRSAWIDSHEVVQVTYRPDQVGFGKLLDTAIQFGCAKRVWTTTGAQAEVASAKLGDAAVPFDGKLRDAKDSDQLYYIERSPYRYLPLTPLQARRVNGALYGKKDPAAWLSPRQTELLRRIESCLSKDKSALKGLERPSKIDALGAYEKTLRSKLAKG